MKLRRYCIIITLFYLLTAVLTCAGVRYNGQRTIDSNPPPSPAVPSPPLPAEPLEVEDHADLETVSDPPNVILELIDP